MKADVALATFTNDDPLFTALPCTNAGAEIVRAKLGDAALVPLVLVAVALTVYEPAGTFWPAGPRSRSSCTVPEVIVTAFDVIGLLGNPETV